jgi:hypothetical protein
MASLAASTRLVRHAEEETRPVRGWGFQIIASAPNSWNTFAAADGQGTTLQGGEGGRTGSNGTPGRRLASPTDAATHEVRRPEGRR